MRSLAYVLLAGCTVSTTRFDSLEPCHVDAHCPWGYRCVEGLCAECAEEERCLWGLPDEGVPCATQADCDDGDGCTGTEACVLGLCAPGTPVDCSALDDSALCLMGACLEGACVTQGALDDTPCQDESFCLGGDLCQSGVCVGGTQPACDDGDICTVDVCDEGEDSCINTLGTEGPIGDPTCADELDNDCDTLIDGDDPLCNSTCPEGLPCDDGLYCNGDDQCESEACVPVGPSPCVDDLLSCTTTCDETTNACNTILSSACLIAGVCYSAGAPNPANACQECVPILSRTDWSNDDSNDCVNGLFCDSLDACESGVCTSTGLAACFDDGLACTMLCDEATDACNVVDSGSCIIDGICRGAGVPDPGNPCQECVPASDQTGWTFDDSNSCADAFSCTDDSCRSGVCTGDPGATCPPGQVCLPVCFGGATGCGMPPVSLALSCPTPEPVPGSSACTATLGSGTTSGQAACISCEVEVGFQVLGHADFQECPGALDGFLPVSGSAACVTSGANLFLEASGVSWAVERSYDTTGLDELELCFSYAENGMDTGDTMTVSLCADGTCASPLVLLADTAGPSAGDTAWHRYCFDVDAHEPLALNNPALVVRIAAVSTTPGHLVQIDDVDLRGRTSGCATTSTPLDHDDFVCTGSACGVMGWASGPGCNIADPCAGSGLRAGSMETLELCRSVDLAGTIGDVFLGLDVGETDADDAVAAESFSFEMCDGPTDVTCACAAGWQPMVAHQGDLDGVAVLSGVRHLLANLDGGMLSASTLGIRIVASATGPADFVEVDRVRVGVIGYLCPSGSVSIGAVTELGGGNYSVDLNSDAATTAQFHCSWDTRFPAVDDRATVEFLP